MKFKKFLPEFGYHPYVLSTEIFGTLSNDEERDIYRAFNPISLYLGILSLLFSRRDSSVQKASTRAGGARLQALIHWLREWVIIPDQGIIWLPFAIWTGWRLIRRKKIDVIVSTSGPETNHLVGACLSKLTGKPLVIDFRDGWLFEPLQPYLRYNRFRRAVDGRLEWWVVSQAQTVITVSDPLTDYFRQTYHLSTERALTIRNGYDPDNWRDVQPAARTEGKLRLVHTGALSTSRFNQTPRPFLEGVARLPDFLRCQLEVLLIGDIQPAEQQAIVELGLADVIQTLPPVARTQSLGYQLSADVLLLMVGTDLSVATSKLYEYLYARRPILAIGHPDAAACRIVQCAQAGLVVESEESEAIAAALTRLYELWQTGGLNIYGQGDISPYDRRHLAGQLAQVLGKIVNCPQGAFGSE
ncbi:MAG: glycosyltransferase [Anaerolineales bacterium]|nr:glycosyltransferase [Anaerolineales bacterium]